jgi:hypothetical protein
MPGDVRTRGPIKTLKIKKIIVNSAAPSHIRRIELRPYLIDRPQVNLPD